MILSQSSVVPYLLRKNLLSPATIVAGDLTVQSATSRNNNFKVISERHPSYVVKQGMDDDSRITVRREAAIYDLLSSCPKNESFTRYLPHYRLYDHQEGLLVLDLLRNARTLRRHFVKTGRFSARISAELGKALALLHALPIEDATSPCDAIPGPDGPWVLSIHRPTVEMLQDFSSANVQLIKIVQSCRPLCDRLAQMSRIRAKGALIHGDLKWDNVVITVPSDRPLEKTLKLVDWELGHIGDPLWDVGCVFSEFLSFWLLSIPVFTDSNPAQMIKLARYPVSGMQSAIRAFWQSYSKVRNLDPTGTPDLLWRSVQYSGARLIQAAFEQMQQSVQLTGNAICCLQVSQNVIERPVEAATHLLGIPGAGLSGQQWH